MAIKNVVFDIGNVVVKWAPLDIVGRTFGPGEGSELLAANIFQSEIWRELNKGHYSEQQAKAHFCREQHFTPQEIDHLFVNITASQSLIEGTLALMDDLKSAGYHLYALTDNVHEIVAYLKKRHDFWPRFEAAVVSAECGLLKPDPEIYQHLAKSCAIVPNESVFLDDVLANVEGARTEDFHAIQFINAQQARHDLAALGLKF